MANVQDNPFSVPPFVDVVPNNVNSDAVITLVDVVSVPLSKVHVVQFILPLFCEVPENEQSPVIVAVDEL